MSGTPYLLLMLITLSVHQAPGLSVFDRARRALLGCANQGHGCDNLEQKPNWMFSRLRRFSACGEFLNVGNATPAGGCDICKTPTVQYTCMDGFYFPDGTNSRTVHCLCNGWEEIEDCQEILCDPPVIPNADIDREEPYNYPDSVTITCMTGFFLPNGNVSYTAECRADGTWTRTDPCVRKSCPEMARNNTKLINDNLPELPFPFSIPVSCKDGYLTSVADTCYTATCLEDATWNFTDGCDYDEILCDPPVVPNADIVPGEPYNYRDSVTITCRTGFFLTNGNVSYTAECRADGTWTRTDPCVRKLCPEMARNNTKLINDNLPELPFPFSIPVSCKDGYLTSDADTCYTAICLEDATWNFTDGCDYDEILCDPPVVPNADIVPGEPYNYRDSVTITCRTGFFLTNGNVSYTAECRADGTWTRTDPCVRKLCPEMERNNTKLINDNLPELPFPFSIPVSCKDGYLTSDADTCYTATCLEDATWNFTDGCDYDADAACPLTQLTNTIQTELPLTIDGGTFYVECDARQVLPNGGNNYTTTCMNGAWDMPLSCGISSCQAALDAGLTESGVYTLILNETLVQVYCEQEQFGGGWVVIQQQQNGTVDFHTMLWADYKAGFGDLATDFWLGLDNIYSLTMNMNTQLKIQMRVGSEEKFANYGTFYIGDSSTNYMMTEDGYSGDGGDGLDEVDGSQFSTPDVDNDNRGSHCARDISPGGWWMNSCHQGNLNGEYGNTAPVKGNNWFHFYDDEQVGRRTPLDFSRMMVKFQPSR